MVQSPFQEWTDSSSIIRGGNGKPYVLAKQKKTVNS